MARDRSSRDEGVSGKATKRSSALADQQAESDADSLSVGATRSAKPQRKSLVVARALAEEVFADESASPDRVANEEDLMRRLGVSRATLREALRLLEALGVVELRLGRSGGIVLRRPDPSDFASVVTFFLQFSECTFRQLIVAYRDMAPSVFAGAARNASPTDLQRLDGVLKMFDQLGIADQIRYVPVVTGVIIELVDNPISALFAQSLHIIIGEHLEALLVPKDRWPAAVKNIRAMAAAVIDGDEERVAHLARQQSEAWLSIGETRQRGLLDEKIVWRQ